MKWPNWLRNGWEALLPPRVLVVVEGGDPPDRLPPRDLVLLRDGGEDWSVAMRCPCGCGQKVELALIREANPRWSLRNDLGNRPTLSPSVWLREGCRSHFFVRAGRIRWV